MILRPYQEKVVNDLQQGFRDGHKRQILSASTGAGKSVIMLDIIRRAAEKGTRSIFIVERRNLAEQFSMHLVRNGIGHGVLMRGSPMFKPNELIQVASAQTLERMESWPDFDLMFVDEVHANLRKGSVLKIMDSRPNLKVVGATATPFHKSLGVYFTNIVSAPPMQELVGMGNLLPFRAFVATEIDVSGLKTTSTGEWEQAGLEERGIKIVGDVVTDYLRLSHDIYGRKSKAILFSAGIAHGQVLAQKFNDAGVTAVQLASGVDEDYKSDVLREFAKCESSVDVVISAEMLTRGFDQPDIEHVILAKPIKKSFSNFVQMIGRGARPHGDQEFAIVQDHGNNFIRFQNEWTDFYENGATSLNSDADNKPKKEPTERDKEAAKCPACGALWPGKSDTCLHCGHVRSRANEISALPGEMVEFDGAPKKEKFSSEVKEAWYQQMLGFCKKHGKKEGCAFYWYKEKFHVEPAWKKQSAEPNAEVSNYCKSRLIAFAKGKIK